MAIRRAIQFWVIPEHDPLRAQDVDGSTPNGAILGGIDIETPDADDSKSPGVVDDAISGDDPVDSAPADSPDEGANPDPSSVAPEPVTAEPTAALAPGLAALIEGVMAARESQAGSGAGVEDPDATQDEPVVDPAEDPPGLTNAQVEQTATTMRDQGLLADGIDVNAEEEPVHSGGGCGLPLANSKSPGADSALHAGGLLALLIVAKRPKRKDDS